jgi:hypothetical protein
MAANYFAIGLNYDEDGNLDSTELYPLPEEWDMAACYRFTSMLDCDSATVTASLDLPWWAVKGQ